MFEQRDGSQCLLELMWMLKADNMAQGTQGLFRQRCAEANPAWTAAPLTNPAPLLLLAVWQRFTAHYRGDEPQPLPREMVGGEDRMLMLLPLDTKCNAKSPAQVAQTECAFKKWHLTLNATKIKKTNTE
jgi:hypothetical protein